MSCQLCGSFKGSGASIIEVNIVQVELESSFVVPQILEASKDEKATAPTYPS